MGKPACMFVLLPLLTAGLAVSASAPDGAPSSGTKAAPKPAPAPADDRNAADLLRQAFAAMSELTDEEVKLLQNADGDEAIRKRKALLLKCEVAIRLARQAAEIR